MKVRTMFHGVVGVIVLTGAAFVFLCALLYWRQENFLFHPGPNDAELRRTWQDRRVEIRSGSVRLEGWWADNPQAPGSAVILYFGGNAEDVLYTAATSAPRLAARRMLVVNYRGFGGSEGTPGQRALFEDALAIYDYAIASGVRPEDIVVMGRSLGSGVATMLASKRTVRSAVLITPYDSIAEVAAHHYAIFPVRWLIRHPFPSTEFAQHVHVPALMLAGARDFIIPPVHAQRLHDAWAGPRQLHVLPGVGHNDIQDHPQYYALINAFLTGAS
jgi:pimeloyl-ACP methyl ester carboxylesterase